MSLLILNTLIVYSVAGWVVVLWDTEKLSDLLKVP